MKNVTLIFIFLFSIVSSAALAEVHVEYRMSKIHGLLNFVLAISGESRQAPGPVELYKRNPLSQKGIYVDQLKAFNDVKENLFYQNIGLNYKEVPGRFLKKNVGDVLVAQSIFSNDLDEYSRRILGLLPKKEHVILIATLKRFDPLYRKIIWEPSVNQLKAHKKQLEGLSKKINLDKMFKQAEIFYKAQWPEEVPFIIGLYPIPYIKDFQNSTRSHSMDSVEEHGVLINSPKQDLTGSFGVIFHELCHSLYSSQSYDFLIEFEKYFSKNDSKYRNQAYYWIDEALATAIGNGWAFKKAHNGVLDTGSWYNHPTIEGFGRGIFPLVEEYLENGKSIDSNFITKAISIYATQLPNSIYQVDNLMAQVSFVHNNSFIRPPEAKSILRNSFFVSSYMGSAPINDQETIKSIQDNRTVVFAFNDSEVKSLKEISKQIPAVSHSFSKIGKMKNRSYFSTQEEDAKTFIFIKVSTLDEFQKSINALKTAGKIAPEKGIIEF